MDMHKSRALTLDEFEGKMAFRAMTVDGKEIPDPTPMAPPVGYKKQPSMWEQMRAMVAREMAAQKESVETPEDALDMGDDEEDLVETLSTYEKADLQMALEMAEAREKYQKSEADKAAKKAADDERAQKEAHERSVVPSGGKSSGAKRQAPPDRPELEGDLDEK